MYYLAYFSTKAIVCSMTSFGFEEFKKCSPPSISSSRASGEFLKSLISSWAFATVYTTSFVPWGLYNISNMPCFASYQLDA